MRIRKSLAAFALVSALAATFGTEISVSAENQGTDGTEIQVMEAEQLEVQLGKEWAGREFQLKTDAGLHFIKRALQSPMELLKTVIPYSS